MGWEAASTSTVADWRHQQRLALLALRQTGPPQRLAMAIKWRRAARQRHARQLVRPRRLQRAWGQQRSRGAVAANSGCAATAHDGCGLYIKYLIQFMSKITYLFLFFYM